MCEGLAFEKESGGLSYLSNIFSLFSYICANDFRENAKAKISFNVNPTRGAYFVSEGLALEEESGGLV